MFDGGYNRRYFKVAGISFEDQKSAGFSIKSAYEVGYDRTDFVAFFKGADYVPDIKVFENMTMQRLWLHGVPCVLVDLNEGKKTTS